VFRNRGAHVFWQTWCLITGLKRGLERARDGGGEEGEDFEMEDGGFDALSGKGSIDVDSSITNTSFLLDNDPAGVF
ncbi:hypothetical protein FRC15_006183, partial [Serendipita sp. 397]